MDIELCKKCIYNGKKPLSGEVYTVCDQCKRVYENTGSSNNYFQEMIDLPECCSVCEYCCKNVLCKEERNYCSASKHLSEGMGVISMNYIRKNYLIKNTPKWCPLKHGV